MFKVILFLLLAIQQSLALYSNTTANYTVVTSTYVGTVTALTTYCPLSTVITTNGATYSVSTATTLTITDCPCEMEQTTTVTVPCSSGAAVTTPATTTPVAPGTTSPEATAATSSAAPEVETSSASAASSAPASVAAVSEGGAGSLQSSYAVAFIAAVIGALV